MIPKHIIEKSIEGGWSRAWLGIYDEDNWQCIALDHFFWESLGRALGWGSGCNICLKNIHSYADGFADECENPATHLTKEHKNPWQINAHRFYDLILTGGDTEKFWEEIMSNKK